MGALTMILWVAAAGALQATVGRIAFGWNLPLLELVVLYYSLSPARGLGLSSAVWAAAVHDSLSGIPLGAALLPLMGVWGFAYAVRGYFFRTSPVTWIVCGFAAAAVSLLGQLFVEIVVLGQAHAIGWLRAATDLVTVPVAGAALGPPALAVMEGGNRALGFAPLEEED